MSVNLICLLVALSLITSGPMDPIWALTLYVNLPQVGINLSNVMSGSIVGQQKWFQRCHGN